MIFEQCRKICGEDPPLVFGCGPEDLEPRQAEQRVTFPVNISPMISEARDRTRQAAKAIGDRLAGCRLHAKVTV